MTFKVYKEEKSKNKQVFLRLEQSATGDSVSLIGVDKDGIRVSSGYILRITSDGKLSLTGSCCVPGISTNSDGEIEVIN